MIIDKNKPLGLKKLWKLVHQEEQLAHAAYHLHTGMVADLCSRRDLLIDMIAEHPKNIYTRRAISSMVIRGLSGHEGEKKPE